MKNLLVFVIVLSIFCGLNFAFCSQSLDVVSSEVETKSGVEKVYVERDAAFGRGIANILTCWLEVPRNIINDNFIIMPGLGVFTGLVKAPFYTVGRFGTGFIDFITFGALGNSLYNHESFPEYVWEADWVGPKK